MTLYGEPRPPRSRGTTVALGFVIVVAVLVLVGMGTAVAVWAMGREPGGTFQQSPPGVSVLASPSAPARKPPVNPVKQAANGTFHTARGSGQQVGSGRIYTYRVQVEDGIDVDADDFAVEVQRILADPRGWTAKGRWGFKRVSGGSGGSAADFVIKLSTPATVDRLCGRYGIDTDGEASCRGGPNVVINLKRWTEATPAYADDRAMYHHLVINHEVGHFLGFSHAQCPGKGQPAPVMQTQMYGLNGCVRNAWPYPTS